MWAVVAMASPLAMFAVAVLVVLLVKGAWPDLRLLGQPNYLPYLGPSVVLLWLASFGFGEEIGWRGFALPGLLSRFSALTASLILTLAWAFFHVPLYWQRPLEGLLFLAPIIPISVILTWFFQGTDGSVPVCAFFHAVFNTWSLSLLSGEIIQPLLISQTIFLIVLAIFLVSRYGPNLSRRLAKSAAGSSVTWQLNTVR